MVHAGIERIDDLDILSAVWILSCIDENPIITYRGIVERLDLQSNVDVRELIQSRRELFRPGVLKSRLEDWKQQMKEGRKRPAWILEIKDDIERNKTIDGLTQNDVFRNQFRVEREAPKCGLEIIDWGLQHLERLRKGALETREERTRTLTTLILPAAAILSSLLLGLTSLGGSIYIQRTSANDTRELKQYEVGFKPKQEGYSSFMAAFEDAILATFSGDETKALMQINRMESSYHSLEPFLGEETRKSIFHIFSQFTNFCVEEVKKKPPIIGTDATFLDSSRYRAVVQRIAEFKKSFQDQLFVALFSK
jgi:hypothetical protein